MTQGNPGFHELRIYKIEPGRLQDMVGRFRGGLSWLFPRHGVNVVGGWSTLVGPENAHFVYLMHWQSFEERMAAFAAFAADPDWHRVRAETNAGSEFLEEFEIHFLHPFVSNGLERALPFDRAGAVHELTIYPGKTGMAGPIRARLNEHELPLRERQGARTLGAFDALTGPRLPTAFSLVEWPDLAAWQQAQADPAAERALIERVAAEKAQHGRQALGRTTRYVLAPVPVAWAPRSRR
ncbi:NIPSNAP family protein [Ruixingdingia sedimenti]|uniref:NIPSNAP family protein n=1 Tax=Ruixingdingia sedimenti TaxID=3073604 RepID=A0ABU1FE28_9RHOB|nr:NIPSNAP family protein [Xinfangfangia sp. LG-4]MDR5654808.1 NIPSNAP family protein [Xinfangfangia sp. LG-4]